MIVQTDGLARLVQRLDASRRAPALAHLADALAESKLTLADVQPYVQDNERNYNRNLVTRREHYELLVMTWLPGQQSAAHDHAGSICLMQVMQGNALEGSYRVAEDGFADLEYEATVDCGQITAGQDAGVHSVRNASSDTVLVTVHLYAPPLRDYRQFVPRPPTSVSIQREGQEPDSVVIVGGGFSGSMAAAQVLRRAASERKPTHVNLIERRGTVGEGVAYGTRTETHLLNVPAGKMSAWPDRPDDFLQWARTEHGEVASGDFLPRQWYGQYIRQSLLRTAAEAKPRGTLSVSFDEVRRVARHPAGGWFVHLGTGGSLRAAAVILAVGHRAPLDPIKNWIGPRARFIADPWKPHSLNAVAPEDAVAVLGSGLTAVDTVLALSRYPRSAPIYFISRRGLLPLAHAPTTPADLSALVSELTAMPGGATARKVFSVVRQAVRETMRRGGDWREIIDGLRPHTPALWRALPTAQRKRFLARVRPFWEVHRHRMPRQIAEKLQAMREAGALIVVAARIAAVEADADSLCLTLTPRMQEKRTELNVRWLVNCTGPMPDNSAASNPAIGSLLVDGWLRRDALGLGIETNSQGVAIARDGSPVSDLLIVGTLRKPDSWESTAVPELRRQSDEVAELAFAQIHRISPRRALTA